MCKKWNKKQNIPKWHYCVFPEKGYHIDLGQYYTYGIQLTEPNHEKILHDVSACKETVFWITDLLNHHQVFPCHFKDVVEDLLQ